MITLLTKLLLTKLLINFIVNYLECNSLCKLVIRKNSNLRTKTTKQILIVSSAFLVIPNYFIMAMEAKPYSYVHIYINILYNLQDSQIQLMGA